MISRWSNAASSVLLLALSLTSCLTTINGALNEYGRADEDTTLPTTTSLQGALQGVNLVTRNNRTIYGFKGIPYAEPPVGDLRFKAPVAAGSWNGTFDASSDSTSCPQLGMGTTMQGDEDCLTLHVYTPKLPESDNSTLLPVIVFIFGGGFKSGSNNPSMSGPDYLLDKDVLFVAPNFRLGLIGYLTTGDEAAPGNYGLKDIVLALKWVQDNIQYFGGDPNQVTLFGQSAGAMTVSLLAISDSTEGLFHKIIMASGTALNLELSVSLETHVNRTYQLAENFGCPTNSSTLLVTCLRGLNASDLLATTDLFYVWESLPNIVWFPTTEPDLEGALFTDTFANLVAAGKHHDVPLFAVVDQTEGDASAVQDADAFAEFFDNVDTLLPYFLGYWSSVDNVTAWTNALKAYYLNNLTADTTELMTNMTEMIGDATFYYPAYQMLQQQLISGTTPLYYACFSYLGSFTSKTSTSHGEEMYYLFDSNESSKYSDDDWAMVDIMVQLWTSFAITGTPTIENGTTTWERYSSLNNYLRIGNGTGTALEMEFDLYIERMQVWIELTSTTSGVSQNQLQLFSILFCLSLLSFLNQR